MEIMEIHAGARDRLTQILAALADPAALDAVQLQGQAQELLAQTRQCLEVLGEFCRVKNQELPAAFDALSLRITQALEAAGPDNARELRSLLGKVAQGLTPADDLSLADCTSLSSFLTYIDQLRRNEMFCLSLRSPVTKKDAVSLITGRLVPILVIDAGGGLNSNEAIVNLEAVTSVPYRAFLTGMLSIPWPKARPLDMKGFISVVGVTSTTPRAEDQLQKVSFALLSRDYMNFSLCLGYHASTIEAFLGGNPEYNYLRFHYQGGAASVERRVRRLQLIEGILSRLGFEVAIIGDLLDARKTGENKESFLQLLEILGRLEVYTKQMDMVMTDDEVVFGYVDDFLAKHC